MAKIIFDFVSAIIICDPVFEVGKRWNTQPTGTGIAYLHSTHEAFIPNAIRKKSEWLNNAAMLIISPACRKRCNCSFIYCSTRPGWPCGVGHVCAGFTCGYWH